MLSSIEIIFQDDHLIAVNKPAGLPVIQGRNLPPEIVPLINQLEKTQGIKLFTVHRLDRETSGIILFAKDAAMHRMLNLQFEHREIKKTYIALVDGIIDKDGRIEQPIRQFGSGRMGVSPKGKESITEYHILDTFDKSTLLQVHPLTGRRHQIRVHLYSIGHPVMGDPLYGKNRPVGGYPRLMLHSQSITFKHPEGNEMTLTVELGEDWIAATGTLISVKNPPP